MVNKNVVVWILFLSMYIKCGDFFLVEKVFSEMLIWNVVFWNLMIVGYV